MSSKTGVFCMSHLKMPSAVDRARAAVLDDRSTQAVREIAELASLACGVPRTQVRLKSALGVQVIDTMPGDDGSTPRAQVEICDNVGEIRGEITLLDTVKGRLDERRTHALESLARRVVEVLDRQQCRYEHSDLANAARLALDALDRRQVHARRLAQARGVVLVGEFDLGALVEKVVRDLDGPLRSVGARVLCRGGGVVVGDADLLSCVLLTLIGDAVRFAREGATPVVEVDVETTDTGWRVTVSDNGQRIPREQQPGVFDQIANGTSREAATSIGLATAKRIVQAHGGRIALGDSELGGVKVWFDLPRDDRREREVPAQRGRVTPLHRPSAEG